jgi:Flp pilus assembly protein TadD
VGEATALFVGERFDDALMAALKIAASHKKNIDALLIMTRCYMHSDDLSKALMSCNAALKLRRKDPDIHLLIADIYDRLDMPEQAEEHKLTAAKLRKKKK